MAMLKKICAMVLVLMALGAGAQAVEKTPAEKTIREKKELVALISEIVNEAVLNHEHAGRLYHTHVRPLKHKKGGGIKDKVVKPHLEETPQSKPQPQSVQMPAIMIGADCNAENGLIGRVSVVDGRERCVYETKSLVPQTPQTSISQVVVQPPLPPQPAENHETEMKTAYGRTDPTFFRPIYNGVTAEQSQYQEVPQQPAPQPPQVPPKEEGMSTMAKVGIATVVVGAIAWYINAHRNKATVVAPVGGRVGVLP